MRVETTQNQKPPEEVDMLPPQNGRTQNPKTSGLLVGENKQKHRQLFGNLPFFTSWDVE